MKCQILFSGKNKKNISKCRLLKILPRVLSVNKVCCVRENQDAQIFFLFAISHAILMGICIYRIGT